MRNHRLDNPALRALSVLAAIALAFAAACTSSNTAAGASTNQNFDQNYRQPTTSQQQYAQGDDDKDVPEPVYTVMEIGTETGEIYPGEDYAVFAVVDKPQNVKGLEYHWSATNGTLMDLPEADRGRIQTIIEQEDQLIRSGAASKDADAGLTVGEGSAPVGAPGEVPGAPGTGAAPPVGAPTTSGTGATGPVSPPASAGTSPLTPGSTQFSVSDLSPEQQNYPEEIKALLVKQGRGEQLTPEETKTLSDYLGANKATRGAASRGASLFERRFVGAPSRASKRTLAPEPAQDVAVEELDDTATTDDARTLADDALGAARRELDTFRDSGSAADNVAEGGSAGADLSVGTTTSPRPSRIRDQYETWSTGRGEVRRRNLGAVDKEEADDEELTAEEAYKASTFVTDVPYVLWSPSIAGDATLYCKVAIKDEDQTDPKPLHVDVTLREAKVEISEEFPDVIREDEDVYIRLDGENLPDFQKGLFTLSFDPDVLSFRSAELGEFFDDAPSASIYFAEPDKTAGKVLLAVDSNTEVAELSGDGPLVYARFKAKQDIEDQEATQLAMVLDNSARYVLDRDGDNVLPVPVEKQPLRSEITTPPVQAEVPRDQQQLAPAAGGLTTAPGSTGTVGGTSNPPLSSLGTSGSVPLSTGTPTSGTSPSPTTGSDTKAGPVGVVGVDKAGSEAKESSTGPVGPTKPASSAETATGEVVGPIPPSRDSTEEEENKAGISGKSNS